MRVWINKMTKLFTPHFFMSSKYRNFDSVI